MSAADRAAELRAQADALDSLAELEAELAEAKQAYGLHPSEETKAAKQAAAEELRAARAAARAEAVTVGGDAFIDNGEG